MVLDNERIEKLASYLNADPERTMELLEMNVEEALAKINADGNDFTTEELQSFAELMVKASEDKSRELDASELESVAGGIKIDDGQYLGWVNLRKWISKKVDDKKRFHAY